MTPDDLAKRFAYHPPKDDQPERYTVIRGLGHDLALYINESCPDSREK